MCSSDLIPALLSATKSVDRRLGFRFIKLIDSKTDRLLHPFMAITEHPIVWQLLFFGQFMDRSMDSSPDRRVSFEPDAWQRRVLDGIDQNKSLLVVGKSLYSLIQCLIVLIQLRFPQLRQVLGRRSFLTTLWRKS